MAIGPVPDDELPKKELVYKHHKATISYLKMLFVPGLCRMY